MFLPLHILIDLGEAFINVPEQKHTNGSSGSDLTIFFILENPIWTSFLIANEEVGAETSIHKCVYVWNREVFLRIIDVLGPVSIPLVL